MQRQFWRLMATGTTTAEASLAVGVSVPVGTRWFRRAEGMTPLSLESSPAATSRSPNARNLRCCALRTSVSVRSPAGSALTPGRSHANCAGTQ
jgi:hypothetical protein